MFSGIFRITLFILVILVKMLKAQYTVYTLPPCPSLYGENLQVMMLGNSEILNLNQMKIYVKNDQNIYEEKNYQYYNCLDTENSNTQFFFDSSSNSYYFSGSVKKPQCYYSLVSKIDSDGKCYHYFTFSSKLSSGITQLDNSRYIVSYPYQGKYLVKGFDTEKEDFYFSETFDDLSASENDSLIKCEQIQKSVKTICFSYIENSGTSVKLFLLDENFKLISKANKEENIMDTDPIVQSEVLKKDEEISLVVFRSSMKIKIFSLSLPTEEEIKIDLYLTFNDVSFRLFRIEKLNEDQLVIASKKDKTVISLYSYPEIDPVLTIYTETSENSNLFTLFFSQTKDKLYYLYYTNESSETKVFLHEFQLLECLDKTIVVFFRDREEEIPTEQLLYTQIDLENIKIFAPSAYDENRKSRLVGKNELDAEEPLGKSNSYYYDISFQFSDDEEEMSFNYSISGTYQTTNLFSSQTCNIDIIFACYQSCKKCKSYGSSEDHKCTICKDGYHFKDGTNNCYLTLDKYYYDKANLVFRPCHKNCAKCKKKENFFNTNCERCESAYQDIGSLSGIALYKGNCTEKCNSNFWYIKEDIFTCLDDMTGCPIKYPYYNENTGECKEYYIPNTNKFNVDVLKLKDPYEILNLNIPDVKASLAPFSGFYSQNFSLHFNDEEGDTTKERSKMYFEDCKKLLKRENNLDEKEEISILIFEIYQPQVNQLEYIALDGEGRRLDLSVCSDMEIKIESVLRNFDLINFTYLEEVKGQNINLFEPRDRFFNDFCFSYMDKYGADVIVKDRRKYYFQNVTLDKNCHVVEYDIENDKITYNCYLKTHVNLTSRKTNWEIQFDEISGSMIKYYICVSSMTKENLASNFGAYFLLICFLIQVGLVIYYFSIPHKFDSYDNVFGLKPQKKEEVPRANPKRKQKLHFSQIKETKNALGDSTNSLLNSFAPNNALNEKIKKIDKETVEKNETHLSLPQAQEEIKCEEIKLIKKGDEILTIKVRKNKKNFLYLSILRENELLYKIFFQKNKTFVRCINSLIYFVNITTIVSINSFVYNESNISFNYRNKGKYNFGYEQRYIFLSFWLSLFFHVVFVNVSGFPRNIEKRKRSRESIDKYIYQFKIRLNVLFFVLFFLNFFGVYYTFIFLSIFKGNRLCWLYNCLACYGLWTMFPFVLSGVIYLFGNLGIRYKNRIFFDISDILR